MTIRIVGNTLYVFLLVCACLATAQASGDIVWNTEVTTTTVNAGNYASPPADNFTEDGVSVTLNYLFPDYPAPGVYTGSSIPSNNYFVTTGNTVGDESGVLGMGMTSTAAGQCMRTRFIFNPAISGLAFPILDIDQNTWRDMMLVRATYQGSLVSGTGTIVNTTNPTVQEGTPAGVTDYTCDDIQNDFGTGLCFAATTDNSGNSETRGNVNFNFPGIVDQLEISYCESDGTHSSMLAAFGDFRWNNDVDDGIVDFGDADDYSDVMHVTPRTIELETLIISNVDHSWQTVDFENTYASSPVVVCSYNLPSATDPEAVVRIANLSSTGFDVRVQRPGSVNNPTASDVYCLVVEEGQHTLPDGRVFEAHSVISTDTSRKGNWSGTGEDVFSQIIATYIQPVVLGQVMTSHDSNFSVFWSYNCTSPENPPTSSSICVGKHIGEDTIHNRSDETLGYIVVEQGTGSFNGISYEAALGGDSIQGVANSPPRFYSYSPQIYDFGVATQEAMDGRDGGWAVLFGMSPLSGTQIDLAIDEDTIGDTDRGHTTEQVAYWVFTSARQPYLGATRGDTEVVSQDNLAANGDDTDGNDDEDGVTFSSPGGGSRAEIVANVQVVNDSSATAYVCAWLDRWTDSGSGTAVLDGIFDTADYDDDGQACKTVAANSTSPVNFTWTSSIDVQGHTYARFRICTTQRECESPGGYASDGEVEDYRIDFDFRPTAVTIGKVELEATKVTDFLAGLDIYQMDRAALLALLQAWDLEAAAALPADAGREEILAALRNYLDPDGDAQVAVLAWDTLEERGTIGFYVDRRQGEDAWTRINNDMLPGLINAPMGGEYRLADPGVTSGIFQYQLIEQEARGTTRSYGPYSVEME